MAKAFKKIFLAVMMIILSLAAHVILRPILKYSLVNVTLADDEEEDDEEEGSRSSSTKTEYKTVYTKLPDQVIVTTKQVPRHDSDGDGMYDDADPHPGINDFLIVKDENLNGIDDQYEQ